MEAYRVTNSAIKRNKKNIGSSRSFNMGMINGGGGDADLMADDSDDEYGIICICCSDCIRRRACLLRVSTSNYYIYRVQL